MSAEALPPRHPQHPQLARRWVRLALPLAVACACVAWASAPLTLITAGISAPNAQTLPRIGVGGAQRLGYGGVLLRAGLPFDYLTDDEQCDPDVLAHYDLLLFANLDEQFEPWKPDALAALDRYVRDGGRLLCESDVRLPGAMDGWQTRFHWPDDWPPDGQGSGFEVRSRAAGPDHPLLHWLPDGAAWGYDGPLIELTGATERSGALAWFTEGPAKGKPALITNAYGNGRYVWVAPQLSYMQSNWTPNYADLILGLVAYLTDGRATAQWADTPADQDPAYLEAMAPEAMPEPPPLPDVPPTPDGWTELGWAAPDGYAIRFDDGSTPRDLRLERTTGSTLHLGVADGRVRLSQVAGAKTLPLIEAELPAPAEPLVVLRQRERVALAQAGRIVAHAAIGLAADSPCLLRGDADGLTFQPLEPVWLTDDFAREAEPLGEPWRVLRGRWLLGGDHRAESRMAGFALRATGGAAVGDWFWSNYRLEVSVRPRSAKAIRLQLARWDDRTSLELRLPIQQGEGEVAWVRGREREVLDPVVAVQPLPALPAHQWSRVGFGLDNGRLTVSVDGAMFARYPVQTLPPGGAALWADGGDVLLDDVAISGYTDDVDTAQTLHRVHPPDYDKGPDGLLDQDTWAHPAAAWRPTGEPGTFQHMGRFAGRLKLTIPIRRSGSGPASLKVTVGSADAEPNLIGEVNNTNLLTGSQVILSRIDDSWQFYMMGLPVDHLRRHGVPVATQVLDGAALTQSQTLQVSFHGLKLAPADLVLEAADVHEYVFDTAPTGFWETEGEWQVGSRWPCMPEWAWLIGQGTPRAALWTKAKLLGDMVVQVPLGVRMTGEYGEDTGEPFERLRLTVCGDGNDPMSGYVVELGSEADSDLHRLYRNGQVVASEPRSLTYPREVHNFWGDLRVERVGARITVWYQHRPLLDYTDPHPLPDGQIGLWTDHNTLTAPYIAVYGRTDDRPAPLPSERQDKRLSGESMRRARPGFDPLPGARALAQLFGWL